jgi:hypothetical protein
MSLTVFFLVIVINWNKGELHTMGVRYTVYSACQKTLAQINL